MYSQNKVNVTKVRKPSTLICALAPSAGVFILCAPATALENSLFPGPKSCGRSKSELTCNWQVPPVSVLVRGRETRFEQQAVTVCLSACQSAWRVHHYRSLPAADRSLKTTIPRPSSGRQWAVEEGTCPAARRSRLEYRRANTSPHLSKLLSQVSLSQQSIPSSIKVNCKKINSLHRKQPMKRICQINNPEKYNHFQPFVLFNKWTLLLHLLYLQSQWLSSHMLDCRLTALKSECHWVIQAIQVSLFYDLSLYLSPQRQTFRSIFVFSKNITNFTSI